LLLFAQHKRKYLSLSFVVAASPPQRMKETFLSTLPQVEDSQTGFETILMKAVVTGGNGFIGRYIVEQLLARGDKVRVIGRQHYPELEALGVSCFPIDLSTQQSCAAALRGCDVVFHVAAKAGVWGPAAEYYRNNVTATQHILRETMRAEVPKFVYTSTPSVVFGEESVEGADESQPYPPRYLAPYSFTKALAERTVLACRDVLTVAIRPPIVWGPRDAHILPRLISRARAGRLVQIGDGSNRVDITYVENAAAAHLLAADRLSAHSPLRGQAYFIGQEEPVYVWEFINHLIGLAGLEPIRRSISLSTALRIAGTLETVYRLFNLPGEPPLTRLTVTQLARSRWFDLRAARRDLGYNPHISTEEGLRRTVAAMS
jgi:nucleoside-diphosphate-sugar epimerase